MNTEIKNQEKEVAANKEALDQGTAIREKQLTECNAEEKDFLESAIALKAVIHQAIIGSDPSSCNSIWKENTERVRVERQRCFCAFAQNVCLEPSDLIGVSGVFALGLRCV